MPKFPIPVTPTQAENFASRALSVCSSLLMLAAMSGAASAAELFKVPGTKIDFNAEVAVGTFRLSEDYTPANRNSVGWTEGYAILGLSFERTIADHVSLFGGASVVVNGNRGDGDPIGTTIGEEGDGQLNAAYGGIAWNSGKDSGPSVRLSGGRQKVSIGDQFVISGDGPTSGRGFGAVYDEGGSYYLNPRRTFSETALLQLETGTPFRLDAFYLKSEKAWQGESSIAGLNAEYVHPDWGKLSFMYIRGLDVENDAILSPFTAARDGLNLFSLSGRSSLGIKDATFAFNYVDEQNDSPPVGVAKLDAWAWYASAEYKFSNAIWTPSIQYRFTSFSGDDPHTTTIQEGYDPLFYGFTKYNEWFYGEIGANYTGPFNSNADVHSITARSAPNIDVGIGTWIGLGAYVNHYSMREEMFSPQTLSFTPGTSGDFGTEFAVFAEFMLFDNHIWLSPLYSALVPGDAYKNHFGKDGTVHNIQLMAVFTY
jgi:hypothetical protein